MSEFFGQEIQIITVSVPVGTMVEYAGDTAPNDWMLCDGRALNRSTYAALFAVLGVKFGSGDGSGAQFNIPDCRDRVTVGASATKPSGATGGVEQVTLSEAQLASHAHGAAGSHAHNVWTGAAGDHAHTQNMFVSGRATGSLGAEGHVFDPNQYAPNGVRAHINNAGSHTHAAAMDAQGSHTHPAAGGGAAHENMQPYVTCNKVIKVV